MVDAPPVRIDLHCHTSASYDGKVDPVRLVELSRERGLTHLAITDHETIAGALAAQEANIPGITVIVGEEVRTTEGDLILLYVTQAVPGGMSIAETVRRAREQGCVVGLAHPFDVYRPSVGRGIVRPEERRRLADLADYVEVHNGRIGDGAANARAADFAREFGLPQVAASDCHTESEIGACYTELAHAVEAAHELTPALAHASLRVRQALIGPVGLFERFRLALGGLRRG